MTSRDERLNEDGNPTDFEIEQALKRAGYAYKKAEMRIHGLQQLLQSRNGRTSESEASITERMQAELKESYEQEMKRRRTETNKAPYDVGMLFNY